MIRTQIQLTIEQVKWLKQKAAEEDNSVAAVIRESVDHVMKTTNIPNQEVLRQRALDAAGSFYGPERLAEKHDDALAEAYEA